MGLQIGDVVRNPQEGYYGRIKELVWPDTAVIEPIKPELWHLKLARHSILEPANPESYGSNVKPSSNQGSNALVS